MGRLLQITASISLILMLVLAGAILVGHAQPGNLIVDELGYCQDDGLCYLKIEPGKTTWGDGLATIQSAPQLEVSSDANNVGYKHSQPVYSVWLHESDNRTTTDEIPLVEVINLVFYNNDISAGTIIAEFGSPCSISRIGYSIILTYPDVSFFFAISESGLFSMNSPVIGVNMRQKSNLSCKQLPFDSVLIHQIWRGFGFYNP